MLNVFDVGFILVLIMCFILGFKNGVIKELVSLIGIIIVLFISFYISNILGDYLCIFLPFIDLGGLYNDVLAFNIVIYHIISFILVFGVLLSVYALLLKLSKVIQTLVDLTIILWLPSKILGGIVGVIKGYIFVFIVMSLLLIVLKNDSMFNNSSVVNTVLYKTPVLKSATSNYIGTISELYSLVDLVENNKISNNQANLDAIDITLRHNIINKSSINTMIKFGKFSNIKNINSVLDKY